MSKQHHPPRNPNNSGRLWAGIIILGIGTVLLAGKLGIDWMVPHWLFHRDYMWPAILITIGLIIGGNSTFRNPAALMFLIFGGFFLFKNVFGFNVGPFIWPVAIIGIGLWLLLGRGRRGPHLGPHRGGRRCSDRDEPYEWDKRIHHETENIETPTDNDKQGYHEPTGSTSSGATAFSDAADDHAFTGEDYLKSTSIFSDVKKTVISKHFRGGEVVNIFGGTDINLVQADIRQPIVIDVFQLFAGMKIIVPSHWKIHSEVLSVFGEVDDKRFTQGIPHDDQKVVYIKGTSIFGGITIKNV